jgi:hypothetical protein
MVGHRELADFALHASYSAAISLLLFYPEPASVWIWYGGFRVMRSNVGTVGSPGGKVYQPNLSSL